jgi:nicotinic acid phosphoribosyltransferase
MSFLGIPLALLTDSYKTTHPYLYPESNQLVAYGEFRTSYEKDAKDERIVFYGIRYIIQNYISIQWTREQVEEASLFFKTHNAGATEFPFPKDVLSTFYLYK